jgi:hypothetical protein
VLLFGEGTFSYAVAALEERVIFRAVFFNGAGHDVTAMQLMSLTMMMMIMRPPLRMKGWYLGPGYPAARTHTSVFPMNWELWRTACGEEEMRN